jgi:hypothetical protein
VRLVLAAAATLALSVWLTACGGNPPRDTQDSCAIFKEKAGWYRAALDSYQRWGVPIHVQMAIVYQESGFDDDARPERRKLLWVIPWKRPSSAYGYAQAIDGTWDWYIQSTGNRGADRDDFDDAVDFIGWYGDQSARRLGIPKSDAYNQYLAFHEGHGGYERRSYRNKQWLLQAARRVEGRSNDYRAQLQACASDLPTRRRFWVF